MIGAEVWNGDSAMEQQDNYSLERHKPRLRSGIIHYNP